MCVFSHWRYNMKKNRRKKTQIKLLISFVVPSSCTRLFIFAFAFMLRYKKKCRIDYSIYLIKIQDNLKLKYLLQGQAILHQILKLLLVHSCVCVCVCSLLKRSGGSYLMESTPQPKHVPTRTSRWTLGCLCPNPTEPRPPSNPPNQGPTWDTFANLSSNP